MYSSKYWRCFHPYSFAITEGHVTSPSTSLNGVSHSIANSSNQSSVSCLSVKSNCVQSGDRVKYSFDPISTLKNGPIYSSPPPILPLQPPPPPSIASPTTTITTTSTVAASTTTSIVNPLSNGCKIASANTLFHPMVQALNVVAPSQCLVHLQKSVNCAPICNSLEMQHDPHSMANINSITSRANGSSRDSLFMNSFDSPCTSSSPSQGSRVIPSELHSSEPIKPFDSPCYWLQANSYPHVYDLLGNRLNNLTPETTQLIHSQLHCNSNKDAYSYKGKSIANKGNSQNTLSHASEVDLQVKKKPRCPRTCFTYEQLDMLERYFNESSQYPDSSVKITLAQLTNLSQARISVWFKNRRAKHRKAIKLSSNPLSMRIFAASN